MRELLFRAKAINRTGYERSNYKNGDWVYGLITKLYNEDYGFPAEMVDTNGISGIEVDYKTIGQYTGLKDRNGVKIFEGDIVQYNGTVHEVVYESRNGSAYYGIVMGNIETWGFNNSTPVSAMEVIGNVFDNRLEEVSE